MDVPDQHGDSSGIWQLLFSVRGPFQELGLWYTQNKKCCLHFFFSMINVRRINDDSKFIFSSLQNSTLYGMFNFSNPYK
jgi:hypothetical protein